MTLERILRSPLVNVGMIVLMAAAILTLHYDKAVPDGVQAALIGLLAGYVVVWTVLVLLHNRRNPERKIRVVSLFPPEFREEDEGQQWMNYRVTRRVYMLYCTGIPLSILVIYLAADGKAAAFICLCLLAVIQQLLYWWELRKWEKG